MDRAVLEVPYERLREPGADLGALIEAAYGPEGLGVLAVSGVPGFTEARARLLPLASRLAALPAAALSELEDEESGYSFGWSHGKEQLEDNRPDLSKGSFYANPCYDMPCEDPQLRNRYPTFVRNNIWPHSRLPELEPAFKALGQLIVSTGALLAAHCDRLAASRAGAPAARLAQVVSRTRCVKARLLHYFPLAPASAPTPSAAAAASTFASSSPPAAASGTAEANRAWDPATTSDGGGDFSSWCGWHKDHGSLTGLTSAMYCDESGAEVPNPDPASGLYIRARDGTVVHARFAAHTLAFQMGEATQIHTGGALRATPHCVRAAAGVAAAGIARNTFAVFIQPNFDEAMEAPSGAVAEELGVPQWAPGQDFGEFARMTCQKGLVGGRTMV